MCCKNVIYRIPQSRVSNRKEVKPASKRRGRAEPWFQPATLESRVQQFQCNAGKRMRRWIVQMTTAMSKNSEDSRTQCA
ncbi:hypothetical protein PoB_000584100 [Plakobranchus ocellatus]|uniref:Uncharacterized protein n=1 Tax=Plakobranchus ocellatus TaxID=259542 RepID=A0AAV3Y7Z6_9GAST|nr:hypothetical protein PoB_000584100 [Plakobranchus ocellatus]